MSESNVDLEQHRQTVEAFLAALTLDVGVGERMMRNASAVLARRANVQARTKMPRMSHAEMLAQAAEMTAAGSTVEEVAASLNVRPGTVRDWMKGTGGKARLTRAQKLEVAALALELIAGGTARYEAYGVAAAKFGVTASSVGSWTSGKSLGKE